MIPSHNRRSSGLSSFSSSHMGLAAPVKKEESLGHLGTNLKGYVQNNGLSPEQPGQ